MIRQAGILAALCYLAAIPASQAQTNTTGYVNGSVRLEDGTGVAGAHVVITNLQTGLQRSQETRDSGAFRFPALPIGDYSLSVEAEGYGTAARQDLRVAVGTGTTAAITMAPAMEEVLVLAARGGAGTSFIDLSSPESATILSEDTIAALPVERNPADVALLAPGTTQGDAGLSNEPLVSFGGASVAENAFFINGMDVTNFRNGLGGSTVPFEFYREFQVKTGGYGAEFGRSTGGVVNTVTRRGGAEWSFGAGAYTQPDSMREPVPDVRNPGGIPWDQRDFLQYNSEDEYETRDVHAYASGPLIDERLFFYAIVQQNTTQGIDASGPVSAFGLEDAGTERFDDDNTFWGVKLDWQITPDHLLEYTGFSDQVTRANDREEPDPATGGLRPIGTGLTFRGGDNHILRYTGYFGQDFTLSALVGNSEYDRTRRSSVDVNPVTIDNRIGAPTPFPTDWINFITGSRRDERRVYRLDGEWNLDRHLLRFGLDLQENVSSDQESFSGGIYWRYFSVIPGQNFQGVNIPDGVTEVVRERFYSAGGSFEVDNTAFYIEDHWQATDDLMLYLGLRNETFANKNAIGETYIEMDRQLGPRLGFSWNVGGEGTAKLFGTAGRYHLPLPSVVSINLSGARTFTEEWFAMGGLNPDGSPDKRESIARFVVSDGEIPDIDSLLDRSLEPSYQDEFIIGYAFEPAPGWSLGVRGIYRELKQAIEDVDVSGALNEYAAANGYPPVYPMFSAYVLTNPGTDARVRFDLDFDGTPEDILLSADQIGTPPVDRTYKAVEFFFARTWRDDWFLQGSYTWSESRGNYEGWTRSDTDQANAALTSSFDVPALTEGAYGRLPSDRPHTVKLFGGWAFAEDWLLSGNFLYQSGRPYGALGLHPELPPFVTEAFYDQGEVVPRGSRGRNSNTYQFDLGLSWTLPLGARDGRLTLELDVFNVLNSDTVTDRSEFTQQQGGAPDPTYLMPIGFQQPRSVRLGARLDF